MFYKFDAMGRRVARTANSATTIYFQSGQQTIADYAAGTAAGSPTYNYVYASYIDEPVMRSTGSSGAKHYFHRNQQYSIIAITDASGGIVERYAYTAYGTPTISDVSGTTRTTTAIGNRYTYTGREYDETLALYHYRARMYDSVGGRFVSRDPIGFTDGLSLYNGYFAIHGVDPSGLECGCGGLDEKVKDQFGNACCAGDMKFLVIWYKETKFKVGWPPQIADTGHAAIGGPGFICGFYPRNGASTSNPNGPGLVVPDKPSDFTHYIRHEACPEAVDDMKQWLDDMICTINDSNSNPFGPDPETCYTGTNGTGGRNCIGFACTGIQAIGGTPPFPPTSWPLPVLPIPGGKPLGTR